MRLCQSWLSRIILSDYFEGSLLEYSSSTVLTGGFNGVRMQDGDRWVPISQHATISAQGKRDGTINAGGFLSNSNLWSSVPDMLSLRCRRFLIYLES
ncbi:hypothetical protein OIU76_005665 [Salix suchowensis]|nr:hypothetical protein OIU78_015552 [Salix suchowensis]KAJ6343968.1 hypothetical protein OIU76_005665 [Salix suchowensis]